MLILFRYIFFSLYFYTILLTKNLAKDQDQYQYPIFLTASRTRISFNFHLVKEKKNLSPNP